MSRIKRFLRGVAILAILTTVFSSFAYGQSTRSTINQSDILYWVGSGANSAILIVNFCDHNQALAWGYRWDGTKKVGEMLSEIDSIDSRLSIEGISMNFVSDFEYNDLTFPNYNFGNDIGSIMYSINGSFLGGINDTYLTDGDVAEFGGTSCQSSMAWSLAVSPVPALNSPSTPTYNITVNTSAYGTITPSGIISVTQGDSIVFSIEANAGYSLAEITTGSVDVTSQILNNSFVLRDIVSDSVITPKFKANKNNTILDNDIQYWVGTGSNKAIFAVNWCEGDTALAWGYRFESDSVTVKQVMDDIMDADKRFAYDGAPYVSSITYTAQNIALAQTSGYWMYNVNEEPAGVISSQKVANGDVIEWGGTNCYMTDDFWNAVWTKTIASVSVPATFNIIIKHSGFYSSAAQLDTVVVYENDSLVVNITPNEGYTVGSLMVGNTEEISQVVENKYTLRNILANDSIRIKFAVKPNNTISDNDIQYWVGTGSNKAIFAVNWCEGDTALAWGYRFESDSVTVKQVMDDIMAADNRFAYDGAPYVSSITYTTPNIALAQTSGYWMYNVNEEPAGVISSQKVTNGDVIEWGGTDCYMTDDFWNAVWTKTIMPVSSPTVGLDVVHSSNISIDIYPNPASNYAIINIKGMSGVLSISIVDINGKEVFSQDIDADNINARQINLSAYSKGVYFVKVKNRYGYVTSKLIVI